MVVFVADDDRLGFGSFLSSSRFENCFLSNGYVCMWFSSICFCFSVTLNGEVSHRRTWIHALFYIMGFHLLRPFWLPTPFKDSWQWEPCELMQLLRFLDKIYIVVDWNIKQTSTAYRHGFFYYYRKKMDKLIDIELIPYCAD